MKTLKLRQEDILLPNKTKPLQSMTIEIREVKTKKELKEFVQFPFQLYGDVPYWIPPIINAEMRLLSPEDNPVFEHSEATILTAWKNGKMVGRIVGIINQMEEDFIGEKHARFGWIDFVEDKEVSHSLIDAVSKWAKKHGAIKLKGPLGFNQLDKNGMLTEGFDSTSTANTIYNYPYYPEYLREMGFVPELEWLELEIDFSVPFPPRFEKFVNVAAKRYGMTTYQPKGQSEMVEYGNQLFDLLMDTYRDLPGFVPISKKQQQTYIERYIKLLRRDFVVIVKDSDGQPIGFSVSLPNLTKAYKKANGSLWPFGIFHLLAARRKNNIADLALIGVKDEWRKKGAHSFIFYATGMAFKKAGITKVKVNPMLEINSNVLSLWKDFPHKVYKRRKTFIKDI